MPAFPVRGTAVEISQSITKAAYIQNTGSERIYFDNESSVSSNSYANILDPNSTMNWPANETLWAITAGPLGMLSVLYGAEGAGVGNVNASITGPVDVTGSEIVVNNPVTILGRGRLVVTGTINLNTLNGYTAIRTITGSGQQVGNSLRLRVTAGNTTPNQLSEAFITWSLNIPGGTYSLASGMVKMGLQTTPPPNEFYLGDPTTQDIGFPFSASYPLELAVNMVTTGAPKQTCALSYELYEVAGDQGFVDYTTVTNLMGPRVINNTNAPPTRIYTPPSVSPLRICVVLRNVAVWTGAAINFYGDVTKPLGTLSMAQWHYPANIVGAAVTGPIRIEFNIPGLNAPTALSDFVFTTTNGNMEVSLLGKAV